MNDLEQIAYLKALLIRAADELEKWQEYEGFLAESGLIEELRTAASPDEP